MTKDMTVAGKLFIPGLERAYWLLHPFPLQRGDDWMRDDMAMFYVALDTGAEPLIACHITVRGPFVIDATYAGRKVGIKEALTIEEELNMEDENPETVVEGFPIGHLVETAQIGAENN